MPSHPHMGSHTRKTKTKRKATSKQVKTFSKAGTGRAKSSLN